MKKIITKRTANIFTLLVILLLTTNIKNIFADITIIQSNSKVLEFEYSINNIDLSLVKLPIGNYTKISINNFSNITQAGLPQLPYINIDAGLPHQGNPIVSWSVILSQEINLKAPITPAPKTKIENGIVKYQWESGVNIYNKISDYPFSKPVFADSVFILRMMRIQQLKLYPVQLHSNPNKITLIKKIRVKLIYPQTFGNTNFLPANKFFHQHLINYDIAKKWYLKYPKHLSKRSAYNIFSQNTKRYKINIGNIMETDFNKDDIYQITGSWLKENNIDISGVNIGNIAIYAGCGKMLPENIDTTTDYGILKEIPIQIIDKGEIGSLDTNDTILFYGQGTSTWNFDKNDTTYYFNLNRYTNTNVYWLVFSAPTSKQMDKKQKEFDISPKIITSEILGYHHNERNRFILSHNPKKWYWDSLTVNSSLTTQLALTQVKTGENARLRIFGDALSNIFVKVGTAEYDNKFKKSYLLANIPSFYGNEEIEIGTNSEKFNFDGYTIVYKKKLSVLNGRLSFFGKHTNSPIRYEINSGSTTDSLFCYRIYDKWNIDFLGAVDPKESKTFFIDDSASTEKNIQYLIRTKKGFKIPNSIYEDKIVSGDYIVPNLRSNLNKADYMIITADTFISEAIRLANHRKSISFDSVNNPVVVLLSDVYDEFSGGLKDPVAIRNFLYFAYHNWSLFPKYVVFFGDGMYDYKNYTYHTPNPFPPYMKHGGTSTDDFFTYLDPKETSSYNNRKPDVITGRLPVQNIEEAITVVDKIIETEDPNKRDMGAWRQNILLTADDDIIDGTKNDPLNHTPESEGVANTIKNSNGAIDIKKVYLFDYKTGTDNKVPEATNDMINIINEGCFAVNYVGHGACYGWAHEELFYNVDVDKLKNKGKYPLLFSASCSVGEFDNPEERTLNETMLIAKDKGAIIGIGATRPSSSYNNNILNKAFYKNILSTYPKIRAPGEAFYLAKIFCDNITNNEMYVFFGDPAMNYLWEVNEIKFTSKIDSVKAKEVVSLDGEILKNGKINSSFNGDILFKVFKGYKSKTHTSVLSNRVVNYNTWDDLLFSGKSSVKSGRFSQTFMVPTKISYGKSKSKIIAFACNKKTAAFGYKDSIYTGGTADVQITDTTGPSISLKLKDDKLAGNTIFDKQAQISLPTSIIINLEDSMGIDVTSIGPDEGLCIEIPDVITPTNINDKFKYEDGSFRKGSAQYYFEVGSIPKGEHKLKITARDGLGNLSEKILNITVVSDSTLLLSDVFNYPNPFSESTKFYYKLSQPASVTIKIFTRSGRLIRIIKNADNPQFWNGKDERGNRLSNNVYFYKIIAKSNYHNKKTVEKLDKLIIAH